MIRSPKKVGSVGSRYGLGSGVWDFLGFGMSGQCEAEDCLERCWALGFRI